MIVCSCVCVCVLCVGGYGVWLDHRRLRAPQRHLLVVPTEPLALAIAQEWRSQDTTLQPFLMHLVSSRLTRFNHN